MIHIFTHDSIGLGEDGPTHQPVEHLASLRAIPGLNVIRPCDANEVAEAWRLTIEQPHQPVALVLTRQDVPILDRARYASAEGLRRGGYVLADPDDGDPELILIATGQRGRAGRRRARAAHRRRHPLPRRQPAVVLSLRPAGRRLPRQRAATRDRGAGLDRGGLDPGLGPLRRAAGREDRHAHVRLLGAAQGRADGVRLHAGEESSRRRARSSRATPEKSGDERPETRNQMKPTEQLHELGQSLWVDNITRTMLDEGTLAALHRRALGHRTDLEPDDLRQGDRQR